MKLLMTTDTVGGVFVYVAELVRALEPFGVEVVLATQGPPLKEDQRRLLAKLDNVKLYESQYRLEWMQDPWRDVDAAGGWLQEIAAREQPEVLHLNDYSHAALPWQIPVLVVAHSCVFSWFAAVRKQAPGPEWSRYRQRVARGLQGADLVVAPTRAMLDALHAAYFVGAADSPGIYDSPENHDSPGIHETLGGERFGGGPSRVIANGIAPRSARQRQLYGGVAKEPLVLAAGRVWDEAKNIGRLAEAAADLRWPVVVAGECRHPNGGYCHYDGVRFLGRLPSEELASWYARAAIYALPARYEPFGLTPLEAAAAGCALVLGDIASLREIWGDAAVFVDPEDRRALTEALHRLAADRGLRTELVSRSQARARQLTAGRMARGYWDSYHDLLRRRDRGAMASSTTAGATASAFTALEKT
ncbi:glycosyltransferase [Candidatus Laterigemmans baculatus]|uniref:glycosyltransferase n=1 Tax=Candidatus Laterigemmans baculatus TaxID=2770505 RepID=UPI00193B1633|nr:glycosyltransferase [Candidatus Laterigemmans baculatus]